MFTHGWVADIQHVYWRIIPFLDSSNGATHLTSMVEEDNDFAVTLTGDDDGAEKENNATS